jgi:DNA-binding GntR family transcriptional regulator
VATRAIGLPSEWASSLGLRRGAPVLAIERVHTDQDGTTPHTVTFLMRTDVVPLIDRLQNPAVV